MEFLVQRYDRIIDDNKVSRLHQEDMCQAFGNCDAHSKNYSILYNTNGKARLSPIYDAVSTTCYPALSKKLSMKIGRHYEIDKVNQDDYILLADSINLNPKRLTKIVTEMKEKIHNSYCAI